MDGADLYAFVPRDHPFHPHIERFRTGVVRDPRYRDFTRQAPPSEVRTRMRAGRVAGRGWRFKWAYLSLQSRSDSGPFRFRALTFLYAANRQRLEVYEFPCDPRLTTAASFFTRTPGRQTARVAEFDDIDVLRYIPRRRLTFRTARSATGEGPVVGKFVRPAELEPAYDTLRKVFKAATRTPSTFSVAAPMGIDRAAGVFFQEALPGTPLTALIGMDRGSDLLRSVGALHRDLHTLDVLDVPPFNIGTFVENLQTEIQWIIFFRPDQTAFLEDVRALLIAHIPRFDPRAHSFCHGDFRCSQVLLRDGRWAVVDFDNCRRADPHLDVARMIAFLKYDVPLFRQHFANPTRSADGFVEAAGRAYLAGYQERAGRALDPTRLLWCRMACEIHCLARMFARDLLVPLAFDAAIRLLHRLSQEFRTSVARA